MRERRERRLVLRWKGVSGRDKMLEVEIRLLLLHLVLTPTQVAPALHEVHQSKDQDEACSSREGDGM